MNKAAKDFKLNLTMPDVSLLSQVSVIVQLMAGEDVDLACQGLHDFDGGRYNGQWLSEPRGIGSTPRMTLVLRANGSISACTARGPLSFQMARCTRVSTSLATRRALAQLSGLPGSSTRASGFAETNTARACRNGRTRPFTRQWLRGSMSRASTTGSSRWARCKGKAPTPGSRYIGQWLDGHKHGRGRLETNGQTWAGDFNNDVQVVTEGVAVATSDRQFVACTPDPAASTTGEVTWHRAPPLPDQGGHTGEQLWNQRGPGW